MALTLKEAITATQTTVDVNGTDALSNGDLYTIEDEQVYIVAAGAGSVQPGQTAWQRLNIQRGQLGTTEVAHTAGTAVTLVTTPLGAGGGGTSTLSLLGPVTVNWNSANIRTSGFKVFDLTALQTVMWVGVRVVTAWDDATENGHFNLGGTLYAPPDEDYQILTIDCNLSIVSPNGDGYFVASEPYHAQTVFAQVTTTGAILFATTGGTSTAGQAHVYALVGTPS